MLSERPARCLAIHPGVVVLTLARTIVTRSALALLLPAAAGPEAWARSTSAERMVRVIDRDDDGTVDLREARAAGRALFARADRNRNGVADARELLGLLTPVELPAADSNGDGTLDEREYLAVVERRFGRADTDRDGTLDAHELNARPGRGLARLLG